MSLNAFRYKWQAIKLRYRDYNLKQRILRLWSHCKRLNHTNNLDSSSTVFSTQPVSYTVDLFFYILDVFAIGELLETFSEWMKFNTRALNEQERMIVDSLFEGSIDVDRIRIDELSIFCRFMKIAFVGIYTIHSFGKMRESLFVHELIHIWQYENLGSVYIPRALRAQRSKDGYNYGGVEALKSNNKDLLFYNYEQQGDILADYWRVKNKQATRWKNLTGTVVPYLPFIAQIKGQNIA